jgi:hypothetical protein
MLGNIIAAHPSAIAANKNFFDGCNISSSPFSISPSQIFHTQT